MLELEDQRWSTLRFAYGHCPEMPSQLGALYAGSPASEMAWASIARQIEHQSTVYDGSYACFPHFISLALSDDNPNSDAAFEFATLILQCALEFDGIGLPAMDKFLQEPFLLGVDRGRQLLAKRVDSLCDNFDCELDYLRLISLYRLQPRVAMLQAEFASSFRCPKCRSEIRDPVNLLCPFPYPDIER